MDWTRRAWMAGATAVAMITATGAWAQKKYDVGASDTEIRIGSTQPLSGPASSYAGLGKAMAAYFQMVNDRGGINGRKVNFVMYDDGYQPPVAVEMTRKLIERDEVLFTLGALGTPTQLAVQTYMNQRKIPQMFVAAPAGKLADGKKFPWTINYAPVYEMEGAAYAAHLLETKPQARVAVLYQDDDAGKAIHKGFVERLARSGVKPVIEQTYAVTDPSIDSQIIAMQASGADAVALFTIPRMTAMALRKIGAIGWKPAAYVSNAGSSIKGALEPAGVDNAVGLHTSDYRKRLNDPRWNDDAELKAYREFHAKYLPGASIADDNYQLGYDLADAAAQVLKMAGDDLTRANLLRIVQSLQGFRTPFLLPGVAFNVTPQDYFGFKQLQIVRFDGKAFVPAGALIDAR